MNAEIVIAGAGVVGCSLAYHLAKRGCRDILVIDQGAGFGEGSTPKATGGFRAQFDSEVNIRLSLLAREKFRAFEDELGADSGYRPYGYLFLACNEAELETLRTAQALQHACGLTEARMIDVREARELCPAIGDESVIGAAFCPTDGFIRAMKILRGYAEAAQRLGVRFQFETPQRAWRRDGVETSKGRIGASIVINALGAWAGAPVFPLRRNVVATVPTDILPETTPMTVWSGDWYHLRVRDGRVLLLWPDDPPDDAVWRDQVQRFTRERAPSLAALPIEEQWSGLYEMTPDKHALLGRSPQFENLYIAAGSNGHGVMHAPALGELLAEMIVDGKTRFDVRALDPGRFQECGGAGTALGTRAAALPPHS
jgi:sarcosine oxidase subunit beta